MSWVLLSSWALPTVQRAELWGIILALQASDSVHLGVDNLGVVRHVGRMLDDKPPSRPFEFLPDGDLLFLIHSFGLVLGSLLLPPLFLVAILRFGLSLLVWPEDFPGGGNRTGVCSHCGLSFMS